MRCLWVLALLVATTGFMVGCNGSDSSSDPSNEGNGTQEGSGNNQSGDQASTETPAAVVTAFLEASLRGNDEKVANLLTPDARKAVAKAELDVALSASDTARFEVVETRKTDPNLAYVGTRWIEQPTPSSEPTVTELAWALRLTEEGWRVGGMVMCPIEGEPPIFLNYEKPKEVIQEYKRLERRRAEMKQQTIVR